ncbi:MAG: AraC family transcriptional regulator [Saonia sp.]
MQKYFSKSYGHIILPISREIELLLGSLGAVQSAFMATYIFFGKKRNVSHILLTLFFLLITLRIIKSLLWVYLDSVPVWFLNLGFMAHLASGPTLLLYLFHFLNRKKWNITNLLHFIPAAALLVFIFKVDEDNFWYRGGYAALLYHQLLYTIAAAGILIHALVRRNTTAGYLGKKDWIWLGILMMGAASIQFAYFSNYILGATPYMTGPVIYAIFIYVIAFFGVTNNSIFSGPYGSKKYRNINIDSTDFERIKCRIADIMHTEKPYLKDTFNLEKLAKSVSSPSYLTSHIINTGFNTNFPDFINSYRIAEAMTSLKSSDYRHIKISEIAYECGFSSLSSFNTAFKKQTGTTPSNFRKNHL